MQQTTYRISDGQVIDTWLTVEQACTRLHVKSAALRHHLRRITDSNVARHIGTGRGQWYINPDYLHNIPIRR